MVPDDRSENVGGKMNMYKIWIVWWEDDGFEPEITVFTNRERAYEYYNACKGKHCEYDIDEYTISPEVKADE